MGSQLGHLSGSWGKTSYALLHKKPLTPMGVAPGPGRRGAPEWALMLARKWSAGVGRETQGLEGEGEERLDLYFKCFFDLPDFDDE